MPITNQGGTVTETPSTDFDQFQRTGVHRADEFALCHRFDRFRQLQWNLDNVNNGSTITMKGGASGSVTLTLPASSGTLALAGESAINSFSTMQPDHGTSPTASSSTDTLTFTSSDASITITGNAGTKTLNFQGNPALTVGAIDSQTAAANGLVISSGVLYAQSASATRPGLVNTTTQTFAGNKTFTGTVAASNLSGTNTGDQTITLTGGVTGSGTGSFVATVITNANLTGPITSVGNATAIASQTGTGTKFVVDTSPTLVTPNLGTPTTLVGTNITGTAAGLTAGTVTTNANLTGDVTSVGNATTYAGTVSIAKGGTGQTTKTPAFDALAPTSALGDISYHNGTNNVRLAGNTTTTVKFLQSVGDGTNSTAPSYQVIPSAGLLTFFYINSASDIGGYFIMQQAASTTAGQTQSFTGLTHGADTTLASFATPVGYPNITSLPPGVTTAYLTAQQTSGSVTIQLLANMYQRTAGGSETLLSTTALTVPITGSTAAYIFQGAVPSAVSFVSTDRLVTKIVARVGAGGGPSANLTITMQDNTSARTEFPASAVDVTNFVPYTGALSNVNLGSNNLTTTGTLTGSNLSGTNTGDVTLAAVGSTPSANSASLSGQVLTLQPADGTHPGVITSGAQTIGGAKTFSGAISASNLSGTNTGDQTITLTGDVTGSGTGSFATTIAANAVTNAKAAQMAANTIKGNNTGSTANALDLTVSQVNTLLGDVTTIGSFNNTSTANGLDISGNTLALHAADATNPGAVSTGTQSLAGAKTFTGAVTVQGNATLASNAASIATLGNASSTALHQTNGGMNVTTRTITTTLTIDTTTTDYVIFCNQSGALSVTLPTPTRGRLLVLKDISGTANTNNITLVRHASEKIEGVAASKVLKTNFGSWTFTSDGTDWWMI